MAFFSVLPVILFSSKRKSRQDARVISVCITILSYVDTYFIVPVFSFFDILLNLLLFQ